MNELILATRNKNKVKEIKNLLKGIKVKIFTVDDFPFLPEVVENGKTLTENAIKKAKTIAKKIHKIALADDSGLEVSMLGGAPGVYSARFSGKGCTYADNNNKLLKLMKNVPINKRNAKFVCVVALAFPDEKIITVEGICKGKIADSSKGKQGFGYDPVFIPKGYNKTYAQLGLKTKNKISHRSLALEKIKKILLSLSIYN
ncbi:MAG: XTP/dITP diphosphatase [Candidatus Firestonebacteria bacterium]